MAIILPFAFIKEARSDDEYASLLRMASSHEGAMAQAFLSALRRLKSDIDVDMLAAGIQYRDYTAAQAAIPWNTFTEAYAAEVTPVYRGLLAGAVEASANTLERPTEITISGDGPPRIITPASGGATGRGPGDRATLNFNLTNPRAVELVRSSAASLVTEVTDGTKLALRDIMDRAFTDGMAPRESARQMRDHVGLTRRLQTAVDTYQGRQSTILRGLHPKWQPDRLAEEVERRAGRYHDKLLRYRTENIARTETMTFSNSGRYALWEQAAAQGGNTSRMRMRWVITPGDRTCEMCRQMDGAIIGWGEKFTGPAHPPRTTRGETWDTVGRVTLQTPPLHNSCRCVVSAFWVAPAGF